MQRYNVRQLVDLARRYESCPLAGELLREQSLLLEWNSEMSGTEDPHLLFGTSALYCD